MTVITRRGAATAATLLASLAAALLSTGTSARAQSLWSEPTAPFALKIGGYLPSSNATRDDLGNYWLSLGASYDFKEFHHSTNYPSTISVYFDYFDRSKTTGPSDFRLRSEAKEFGLGIADRYYLAPKLNTLQPYVGAGVGVYDVKAQASDPSGNADKYKTAVGAKFLVGTEFHGGLFVDGEYNWLPEPNLGEGRVNLSGYQLRIGYRF